MIILKEDFTEEKYEKAMEIYINSLIDNSKE